MDISRRRLVHRLGGGLAVLIISAAGLSAAGATAPSAEQSKVLVAETITCGTIYSTTVDGVSIQIEPCVRRGPDMYGGGDAINGLANVTITADPAQPVDVCRISVGFRQQDIAGWGGSAQDCLDNVDAGPTRRESTQIFGPPAVVAGTTLVTVEFAAVDGPVKVVSTRASFTGV